MILAGGWGERRSLILTLSPAVGTIEVNTVPIPCGALPRSWVARYSSLRRSTAYASHCHRNAYYDRRQKVIWPTRSQSTASLRLGLSELLVSQLLPSSGEPAASRSVASDY